MTLESEVQSLRQVPMFRDIDPADYVPACVEACPSGAIQFVDLNASTPPPDSFRLLERLGAEPKIYYRSKKEWVKRNG